MNIIFREIISNSMTPGIYFTVRFKETEVHILKSRFFFSTNQTQKPKYVIKQNDTFITNVNVFTSILIKYISLYFMK